MSEQGGQAVVKDADAYYKDGRNYVDGFIGGLMALGELQYEGETEAEQEQQLLDLLRGALAQLQTAPRHIDEEQIEALVGTRPRAPRCANSPGGMTSATTVWEAIHGVTWADVS